MKKEELKSIILENRNLDLFEKIMIERFFSLYDDITVENFNQRYIEWCNSFDGEVAAAKTKQVLSEEKDRKIEIGLTTIERGDYHFFRPNWPNVVGEYVVIDNNTGLWGLLSKTNEEILPCIFDDIYVKLDWLIIAHFKGTLYEFNILSLDYKPDPENFGKYRRYDFNGGIWYYRLVLKHEPDYATRQLISLLSTKHAPSKHNQ